MEVLLVDDEKETSPQDKVEISALKGGAGQLTAKTKERGTVFYRGIGTPGAAALLPWGSCTILFIFIFFHSTWALLTPPTTNYYNMG